MHKQSKSHTERSSESLLSSVLKWIPTSAQLIAALVATGVAQADETLIANMAQTQVSPENLEPSSVAATARTVWQENDFELSDFKAPEVTHEFPIYTLPRKGKFRSVVVTEDPMFLSLPPAFRARLLRSESQRVRPGGGVIFPDSGEPRLFFQNGKATGAEMSAPFSDGLRCAGQHVARLYPHKPDYTNRPKRNTPGHTSLRFHLPLAGCGIPLDDVDCVAVGETRHYDYWTRNPVVSHLYQELHFKDAVTVTWSL